MLDVLRGVLAATAIVVTWAGFALVLAGCGRALSRTVLSRPLAGLPAFWLGLGATLGYITVAHLLVPATGALWLPLTVVAGWEAIRSRSSVRAQGLRPGRGGLLTAAFGILAIFWLADLSILPPAHYDSGLYHLQAIRWAGLYPDVPGLANLHFRLGFNSSWWSFVSSLGVGPWRGQEAHLATGLVLAPLVLEQLHCLRFVITSRSARPDCLVGAVLLPVSLSQVAFGWVSSPNYDQTAYALAVATTIYALRALDRGAGPGAEPQPAVAVPVAVALALATLVVRIQNAPLGAIVLAAVVLAALARRPVGLRPRAPLSLTAGAIVMLGAFAWQGIVTSGYPLFPLSIGATGVSWSVPAASAAADRVDTATYARGSRAPHWLHHWFVGNLHDPTFRYSLGLTAVSLLAAAAGLALRRAGIRTRLRRQAGLVVVLLAVAVNAVGWFRTAPDPRLGMAALWVLAATVFAGAVVALPGRPRAAYAGLVLLALSVQSGHALAASGQLWPKKATGAGLLGVHNPPVVGSHAVMVAPGLLVSVPNLGDQCWATPLPCAPNAPTGLIRRGTSLRDGFRVH